MEELSDRGLIWSRRGMRFRTEKSHALNVRVEQPDNISIRLLSSKRAADFARKLTIIT